MQADANSQGTTDRQEAASSAAAEGLPIQGTISDSFAQWLSAAGGSVAISTYQAGKVALLGSTGSQVNILMRHFDPSMFRRLASHGIKRRDLSF
jgi:hypothetical protein